MMRRRDSIVVFAACAWIVVAAWCSRVGLAAEEPAAAAAPSQVQAAAPCEAPPWRGLQMFEGNFPLAHFFRSPERAVRSREPFDRWERNFGALMGIEGKTLNEEEPDFYPFNVDYFTRFKADNPRQLVLLHMNGNARDPRFQIDDFFAGHWLYFNGSRVAADIPSVAGECEIVVDDPTLFRIQHGRRGQSYEDVGLCMLDAQGKPDWRQAEQVRVLGIDPAKKTLRVLRGQFGTAPRAFPAGKSYAAAHAAEGPWNTTSNMLWFYNFSSAGPRDAQGRTLADVLSDDIAKRFNAGGELAAYDGLEFDVLFYDPLYNDDLRQQNDASRGPDLDADGKIDPVFTGPGNSYGVGCTDFVRQLRAKMGDDKLIMADGMHDVHQRAFGILNGIESEGWPSNRDSEFATWSAGLDRFWFWEANSFAPQFSYIRHGQEPGAPFARHRLTIAAAALTGTGFAAFSGMPRPEADEKVGVFDELRQGAARKLGWLGKPIGPAVRLATQQPDLLAGRGTSIGGELLAQLVSDDAQIELVGRRLKISGKDPQAETMHFRLKGLRVGGPNLLVQMTASALLPRNAPPEIARIVYAGAGQGKILRPALTPADRWNRSVLPLYNNGQQSWINGKEFTAGFYFRDLKDEVVDVEFEVESAEPIWISRLAAFAHPDAMYRQFEHGIVLANPSLQPYKFDLAKIVPGVSFRRLQGSSRQDPKTNDGSAVSGPVELAPIDGLFLIGQ